MPVPDDRALFRRDIDDSQEAAESRLQSRPLGSGFGARCQCYLIEPRYFDGSMTSARVWLLGEIKNAWRLGAPFLAAAIEKAHAIQVRHRDDVL